MLPRFILLSAVVCIPLTLGGCNFADTATQVPNAVETTRERQVSGDDEVNGGQALIEQREFAQAIEPLERALAKPLNTYSESIVLTMIGNCYSELEQLDQAFDYYDRAIAQDPDNYKAYVAKGVVHRLQGDYDDAAAAYDKALVLAPDYAELHASIGGLAIFQDDLDKAITHLEKAVTLDDSVAISHSNLAVAYAMVGRFDDADNQLKKAVVRGYHQPEAIKERIDQLRNL